MQMDSYDWFPYIRVMDSISLYTCSIISEMIELDAGANAEIGSGVGSPLPKLDVVEVLTSLVKKHQVGNFILYHLPFNGAHHTAPQ